MRAVVQRVSEAQVRVEQQVVGQIGRGLLVLLGVEQGDELADVNTMVDKLAGLRIFEDDAGLMNLNVSAHGGAMLVVSQFTLLGDVRRGKRPSFTSAAPPEQANELYQRVCQQLRDTGLVVEQGVFQADMQVSLVNDGPVTILIDSRKRF
jgi:D-tyrosyl-tRNA(Tyr) deacylase